MCETGRLEVVRDLLEFVDSSPTPYHAVHEATKRLQAAGFVGLDEREPWQIDHGQCAYVTRGGGSLVALRAGTRPPSEAGFLLLGAHTDSPGLRVKPLPDVRASGYLQLGVELYGGPLWFSWLDRDLSVAGRVSVRGGHSHLARFDRPLCRIPSLAVHLNRKVNQNGLTLNAQDHLVPILMLQDNDRTQGFLDLLAVELQRCTGGQIKPHDLLGYDLCLYDTQRATLGGAENQFIFASRLDNLVGCHAALRALLRTEAREATQLVVLYDNEETGSRTASGAQSRLLISVLERIVAACGETSPHAAAQALARSLLVSVDMAHAVHPNYKDKHDRQHLPALGKGPVIKFNANKSYATDGPAAAVFAEACQAAGFEPQRYASRNDLPCGSTIGPIAAARTGIRTVDVGSPMLSMHSCREMAAAGDVQPMIDALTQLLCCAVVPPATS